MSAEMQKAPDKFDLAAAMAAGTDMTVVMTLLGPAGKMWSHKSEYLKLPPRYLFEVASTCGSLLSYIRTLATTGRSSEGPPDWTGGAPRVAPAPPPDKAGVADPRNPPGMDYTIEFKYTCSVELPPPFDDIFNGEVGVPYLRFTQAVEAWRAGVSMLNRLVESAEIEIKAGQRA